MNSGFRGSGTFASSPLTLGADLDCHGVLKIKSDPKGLLVVEEQDICVLVEDLKEAIGLNAFKCHFFRTNIQKPKDVRMIWIE